MSRLEWLAQSRASWAAALLLLAGAAALTVLQSRDPAAQLTSAWRDALAPSDDIGRAVLLSDAPPSLGALMLKPEEEGR